MTKRALCIHGHFYQPPRQDVLTGIIPRESGTTPYQNWNEKIHAECYLPNARLGNFTRMSFNIGPTLFKWMEEFDPETYQQIIIQDRVNLQRYGVGNAMAQPYNHTILPLANDKDKQTQITWGIADFIHRFGHAPAGMWLPEAAVDQESMCIMADHGIQYTILAPWQAQTAGIDVRRPYRVDLGDGKNLTVFFYHMELSTRVSFDPVSTSNADLFVANHIAPNFLNGLTGGDPQILLIASDGELYGHHQPFRDKFLERMLDGSSTTRDIEVVFPGLYLKQYPVTHACQIHDQTSWSCHHGVDRWKTDCGCTPHSDWKAPLREGLNQIAGILDSAYEQYFSSIDGDPWKARNEYIQVMLKNKSWAEFADESLQASVSKVELKRLNLLMQAQIARQWMFTSCGWFFDEFDRIEPRNNVSYAAQAVYLTEQSTGIPLMEQSLQALESVQSNRTGLSGVTVFTSTYQKCQQHKFPD
jgi:alpha-amylase/alpha-mannosidase (GH57 family)